MLLALVIVSRRRVLLIGERKELLCLCQQALLSDRIGNAWRTCTTIEFLCRNIEWLIAIQDRVIQTRLSLFDLDVELVLLVLSS